MNNAKLLATIALAASTFATGCAADSTDCVDAECPDAAASDIEPALDYEISEGAAATPAVDQPNQIRPMTARVAALQDWVLRLVDSEADACDQRMADAYQRADRGIDLTGCETSFIVDFVRPDELSNIEAGRYEAVALEPLLDLSDVEQKWMTLGLRVADADGTELSDLDNQLIAEADRDNFYRNEQRPAAAALPGRQILPETRYAHQD